MGPGERNPDGIPHAAVEFIAEGEAIVGFEDLYGGGDRDYDDVVFIFRGSIVPEQCGNGVDDDRDGLIDCEDADCAGVGECGENCDNNRDDDGDGLVDCLDADCFRGCAGIGRCRNWPRITSLFPIQGANIGSVTVTLGCCNVQEGASIYLDGLGGEIPGQNLGIFAAEGSSTVQVSFDLRGKLPGVYDIYVNNPDTTYTFLRGAFTITQGSGRTATPWLDLASREVFRMGRAQRINIFYGNSGTVDTSAKLILLSVSGDEQAWLQTDVFDIPRSELVLLAGSLMGEALSLGAGQSWTYPLLWKRPICLVNWNYRPVCLKFQGVIFPGKHSPHHERLRQKRGRRLDTYYSKWLVVPGIVYCSFYCDLAGKVNHWRSIKHWPLLLLPLYGLSCWMTL